jgi:DNA-binding NarL/FixJ family response regulator
MDSPKETETSLRLKPRRILLVDDEPAFLDLALRTVSRHYPIELVGRAATGLEAVTLAHALSPDVVIMDFDMPGMDGLHATSWIKSGPRPPVVVVISGLDNQDLRTSARAAGADGFCGKMELAESLNPLLHLLWPSLASGARKAERADVADRR